MSLYQSLPLLQVRKEMVEEKGLAGEAADKIGTFVLGNAGPAKELWAKLTEQKIFGNHPVCWVLTASLR